MHCRLIFLLLLLASNYIEAQKLISKGFIGHTDTNTIHLWCMFKNTDSVSIKITDSNNQFIQLKTMYFNKSTNYKNFFPVNIIFENLSKNTNYNFHYSLDKINYTYLLQGKTDDNTLEDISFLAGSCAFIGTGLNSLVKPFNNLKIFDAMAKDTANLMLWLGDNVYYIFEYKSYKKQLKRNINIRHNEQLNYFLSSKQQYSIWDDHDYGSNNSGSDFKNKNSSLNVFKQFWCNPENDSFNYYTFKKSDVQFFMLDNRFYKTEDNSSILGQQQLQWLKTMLQQSDATFKIIGLGMQAINPYQEKESFYQAKKEYEELLQFIKDNKIEGILFLSGDRHFSELNKKTYADLYPLYDFTISPLSMYPVKKSKTEEAINPNYANSYYSDYNYAKISIAGIHNNRTCTLEIKDNNGNTIWNYQIKEDILKFKKE